MVGLAFAIACSANFPALLLSIVWRRFTTRGAVASIWTGALLTVVAHRASAPRSGWTCSGSESAPFPLRNPAIVSMTIAILVGVVISLAHAASPAPRPRFDDEKLRTYLGVGAE